MCGITVETDNENVSPIPRKLGVKNRYGEGE